MLETLILKALLPVVAGNAQGFVTWLFAKKRNGEDFSLEKVMRTAFAGLVVAIIAWSLGLPVDEQNLATVAAEYAVMVNLLEQTVFKRAWDMVLQKIK